MTDTQEQEFDTAEITENTSNIDHIEKFARVVFPCLPDDRSYCMVFWGIFPHEDDHSANYHVTKDELPRHLDFIRSRRNQANMFWHLGLRRSGLGTKKRGGVKDVVGILGFAVDIDIAGDGHSQDKLPPSVLQATELLDETYPGCPPTLVVSTGGGIHAYWLFETPWIFQDDEEREKANDASKSWNKHLLETARAHGWILDNVGSIDHAMRMPGTLNLKDPASPKPVRIVRYDEERRYTPEKLIGSLPEKQNPSHGSRTSATVSAAKGATAAIFSEYSKPDFGLIMANCSFMQHCVNDAEKLSEPEWHAFISICAPCENGENLAHQYSKPHPKYNYLETQGKVQRSLAHAGPFTCDKVAERTGGSFCKNCLQRGKVKSPIVLGRKVRKSRNEEGEVVEELNKDFAVIRVGGKVLVLHEHDNPITGYPSHALMSIQDFKGLIANRHVLRWNGTGMKKVPWSTIWIESPERREYEALIFDPSELTDSKRYYNLWGGFAVKPEKGEWARFKRHLLKVICGGDERICHYLLAWMARIVQDPGGKRPGVAIVIRGREGTGKGTIWSYFGKIFGQHFVHITNQHHLTGKFNTCLQDALLVFCDEGFFAGDKAAEGMLKGLITEDTINIEPKGKDTFQVKNHVNLVMCSNNDWIVPAGMEARRFLVLEASDEHMQDTEYFGQIHEEMDNGGLEAMLYDLLHMDISDVNLRNVPRTQALMDQIQRSMTPVQKYWFERLQDGTLPKLLQLQGEPDEFVCEEWHEYVETDTIHKHYLAFCREIQGRYPHEKSLLGKKLRGLCPCIRNGRAKETRFGKRPSALYFPSLEDCRKAFETAVNMKIQWPEDECAAEMHLDTHPGTPSLDMVHGQTRERDDFT